MKIKALLFILAAVVLFSFTVATKATDTEKAEAATVSHQASPDFKGGFAIEDPIF